MKLKKKLKKKKLKKKLRKKEETKEEEEEKSKIDDITKVDNLDAQPDKKIIKTKSTKITEETIELTDPKAVAEALGLNDKKKRKKSLKKLKKKLI